MKRWAIFTVFLYALTLILLTVPVAGIAFGNWGTHGDVSLKEILKGYTQWQYWLWLGVLVGGQAVLLLLPLNLTERRLPARRPLRVPIIVTAFFLANLCFAGVLSLLYVLFHDDAGNAFSFVDRLHNLFLNDPSRTANTSPMTDGGAFASVLIILVVFWTVWGFVFRHFARDDDEATVLQRLTRWLLRGSILELIIAVPSHVIVRRRDDCCAPLGTFWGITTGISVMLLCFGPGVYFLFVKRMNQLKPKAKTAAEKTHP